MILGIDPKNDYAFKCLFGSEHHTSILIHLLNAVLQPAPGHHVVSVQILNPITEPVKLDDKLAILDIKARDQSGRHFNVEMQMVLHPALESRFLYYWAKTYSNQLISGDQYQRLAPVVSICFLDGMLFPETDAYHLQFRLSDTAANLTFSDDLAIHVFQLPNFVKTVGELESELDIWLYFLNNGKELDSERFTELYRFPELLEALGIVATLTQDDIKREYYEAREKARRDALSWKGEIERSRHEVQRLEQEAQKLQQETQRLRQEVVTSHSRGVAKGLIGQIRLCEQLLHRDPLPDDQLTPMSLEQLQNLVAQLRQELTNSFSNGTNGTTR